MTMLATEEQVQSWMRGLYRALAAAGGKRSFMDCMAMSMEGLPEGNFRTIVGIVRQVVGLGHALSDAMSLHPSFFSRNHITVVRYGEIYGELDLTLQRYVDRPEDRAPKCRLA